MDSQNKTRRERKKERLKNEYFEHLIRISKYSLLQTIIMVKVEEKRRQVEAVKDSYAREI